MHNESYSNHEATDCALFVMQTATSAANLRHHIKRLRNVQVARGVAGRYPRFPLRPVRDEFDQDSRKDTYSKRSSHGSLCSFKGKISRLMQCHFITDHAADEKRAQSESDV